MSKVKNSGRKHKPPTCCDSWLAHWSNATKQEVPKECSAKGCRRPVDVGAHVINCAKGVSKEKKIVPLCNRCNAPTNTDCFPLNKGVSKPSAGKLKLAKKHLTVQL